MSDFVEITLDKLNLEGISDRVASADCGAISIFVGTTRNRMGDKKVLRLEYESYDSMALKEMKKICTQIRQKWTQIKNIAIVHKIGNVDIKETSIIIAISSPHRKDSLDAVNYCINEVKKTVPIWKKVDSKRKILILKLSYSYIILIKKEWYEDSTYVWKENCECMHMHRHN